MLASHFRILLADDHALLCHGLRRLLEDNPAWQVVGEAREGREALRLARETKPDLAILDYSLPQMNGVDLTRAIKRNLPRTEILIYTMYDSESLVVGVLDAGARGYVLKSDSTSHLLAAVEALSMRKPYFSPAISLMLVEAYVEAPQKGGRVDILTPRERQVVRLISEGPATG